MSSDLKQNEYNFKYGLLCSKLGDLESKKHILQIEINKIKQQIAKLNAEAGSAVKKLDISGAKDE